MGKATGFLEYVRMDNADVPIEERICNYDEFHRPLNVVERQKQGARCMNCGVPFCQSAMVLNGMVTGCPLHNLVPEWNDQIYRGHFDHGYARLAKTSNFPEFTGRVCPALCEKACINGEDSDPVTIHDNELFLIETAFANGTVLPRIPRGRSGRKVAVIGSGPSGLAVADTLNHRGHTVTVFERDEAVGGLLRFGIPNMKLDKSVIDRRQKLMEAEGVVFRCNTNIGKDGDVTPELLKKEYDAIVLACGARRARTLPGVDPQKIGGVYYAVDFLGSTTRALAKAKGHGIKDLEEAGGYISAKGKNVVVVGGGDTGNDCIGTCIRHGCASVTALEMMPQPPKERAENNPWPEWPKVLKVDYGHAEAIRVFGKDPRVYSTTVKEVRTDAKGNIAEIVTVRVRFKDGKMVEEEGSEQVLPCELLLIAAGFTGCESYVSDAFGVSVTNRGRVETEADHYASNQPGIFTAGDMHRGSSLVVWAISEGRQCAQEVDQYLMGYSELVES